jgi:hypothetical protein
MDRIRSTLSPTSLAAALALAILLRVAPAGAVDVRQPDTRAVFTSDLSRAYAQCTTPNALTRDGKPACAPAVTSQCKHIEGNVSLWAGMINAPLGSARIWKASSPASCQDGDYAVATLLRYSGDYTAAGPEAPCASGLCTWPDVITSFDMRTDSFVLTLTGGESVVIDGNYALSRLTIYGPDGLAAAAPGISGTPLAERFFGNLTVPIEPCTTGAVCDLAPWTSPCDFASGDIVITRADRNVGEAHVTLRNVTGTSPVCRTGTYLLEATVRGTVRGCGTPTVLCTLPDTTLTLPLEVRGRDVEGGGLLGFASFTQQAYDTTQILDARVIDPTGVPIATVGLAGPSPLRAPRVTVKGNALRVRATIPIPNAQTRIDPASDPGLRITVSDRDGVVYDATIPQVRWQLQPPIGSRWTYADKGGVLNGVQKASVTRFSKKAGTVLGYDVDLQARDVDLSAADHASLTVNLTARNLSDDFGVDQVFKWQGTRTCRGTYPKLVCK